MNTVLFNFHDVVLLVTTYQCALFALLLLFIRHGNRTSFALLAAFLATQAFIPLNILINYGEVFRAWAVEVSPNAFRVFGMAYWLEGPVLLWYTRSLIYKDFHLSRRDLWYLVPFFAYAGFQYITFFSLDTGQKLELLSQDDVLAQSVTTHTIGFLREAIRFAFGVLCVMEIRRCQREVRDTYSNMDSIDFSWLSFLIIGFLVLRFWALFVSIGLILNAHFGISFLDFELLGLATNYTVLILVSVLIFLSLTFSSMFESVALRHNADASRDVRLTVEIDEGQIKRLEDHMDTAKPYLANILTVEQLAEQVSMSKRNLSNIINRHFGKNFFEFVNHYRIEEAKRLLREPDWMDRTLLDVMSAAGFNSKATFNTFFKKTEGMTPSEYRELNAGS